LHNNPAVCFYDSIANFAATFIYNFKSVVMKKILLYACLALLPGAMYAQSGSISGKISDADTNEALPGANVVIKGTSTGTTTGIDGAFALGDLKPGSYALEISFIGYDVNEMIVNVRTGQNTDLGDIQLGSASIGLKEVEIIASVAIDRKTPVAVAQVDAMQIEERASNQEFPELLKSTPGVYTTKQGGGYGDSRISLRGFNSVNVAVMINGIPVNDMENGRVYWSNWAGLTDVTQSMQVQRGLGASKVAVPSIGGTINILTQTTEAKKGGNVFFAVGNDGYAKKGLTLSTGLMDNGWAISLSGSEVHGDGFVDGTAFQGYNYFFNLTKKINAKHLLSFTGFGAPQRHGQRPRAEKISTFRNAPQGIRFNSTWGYRDGQEVLYEDNFYHKPQFSLNHYWTIDEKSELSTAAYMSFGTGGGGGIWGDWAPADRGTYEPKDIDALVDINRATADGNALALMRASRNDHRWFGLLSTYNNRINENFTFLAGLDLRHYVGSHFYEITDLLGADYYLDDSDINNPTRLLNVGDKFNYNNDGIVNWTGGFLQGEYSKGAVSAFVNLSLSNTGYKRIDYFNYANDDPMQESDFSNHFGYQIKGGFNYNLTTNHNLFANIGYFERAPDFDAIFLNNDQFINDAAVNQKILSYEVGYGYRSADLNANVNLYRTSWLDRTLTQSFSPREDDPDTPIDERDLVYNASLLGVNALHQGIEIDFVWQPVRVLEIEGMVSLGDWKWMNDVDGQAILDENQDTVDVFDKLYIGGLKVGDVAQSSYSLGAKYEIFENFKISANLNYFDNLYAEYDPNQRTTPPENGEIVQPIKFPDYTTVDAFIRYDFNIGSLDATFIGNVNNIFDTEYIAEGNDNTSIANSNVWFGFGRTYTLSLKVGF
jgi:iron complex outermembrane receptor protein